jgi:GntR family transcriptional regulator
MVCYLTNTPGTRMHTWNDQQPIYQQLADLLAGRLLDGEPPEGDAMPSVRQLAGQFLLNPLTVTRALQTLDEEGLLENRRGVGLYVVPGARDKLRRSARLRFLNEEWPRLRERLRRLGIGPDQLQWENPEEAR